MYVGVDVSKDFLDVAFRPSGERLRVTNDPAGIAQLIERLQGVEVKVIVLEASGGFEQVCAAQLVLAKLPAAVVNPRQVRDFAKATGRLAKTDVIDAEVLAHFGATMELQLATLDDEVTKALRELVTRRAELVEMRTMETNRKTLASEGKRKELDEHIRWLNTRIKDVEKGINKEIRKSKVWLEKAKLLETAVGIGPTTSAKLIVDLPELGRVSNKQIAALIGAAPYNDDSGKHDGKRHCRGGRADVRTALYMPTMVAIQHEPRLGAFYARLRAKGKTHKVAIVACMRKLIIVLNVMVRTNTEWKSASPIPTLAVDVALKQSAKR